MAGCGTTTPASTTSERAVFSEADSVTPTTFGLGLAGTLPRAPSRHLRSPRMSHSAPSASRTAMKVSAVRSPVGNAEAAAVHLCQVAP
eukprot:scaffold840_cov265-Pinguiococcus_pyrenoidosus.AAC.2